MDYVRLIREPVDGVDRLRVIWKDARGRHVETFEDTRNGQREARAFAEAKHDALRAPAPAQPISAIGLRDLFDKYITAMETEWSHNTLRLRKWRWGKLELFAGRDAIAHTVTRETLDGLKKALLVNHSPNQVRQAIKEITGVFRWAVDRDLIPPTKVITYRAGLKKALLRAGPKMEEYSRDERDRLQAAFNPRSAKDWRPWALNVLFAYCGPRQTAARFLEIADIQLDAPAWTEQGPVFGGRIQWRAETNKTQQDWAQPMPGPVAEAFWVALGWRQRDGYTGRYVFYGVARKTRAQALRRDTRDAKAKSSMDGITIVEKPYSYAAFNDQLHRAEVRQGMTPVKYKAAHAHRRGVAGDIHAETGSEKTAADWIGDKSTKVVRDHYLLQREAELAKTAGIMGRTEGRSEVLRNATGPESGSDSPALPPSTGPQQPKSTEPAVGIEPTTARSQRGR